MNAPIPHSVLSSSPLQQYSGMIYSSYAEMPPDLRSALLANTLEILKISIIDPAKVLASRLRPWDFAQVIQIIDTVRTTALNHATEIHAAMDHGRESSFNGELILRLADTYSINGVAVKASVFIALSDALARQERLFIRDFVSLTSTTELVGAVAVQVVDALWGSDWEIFEEPKNITLQNIRDMELAEILALDTTTMRLLLESAFDSMCNLYEPQMLNDIENIGPSFNLSIPEDPIKQSTFWIGFIRWQLIDTDTVNMWELKVFLAFNQLDHSSQLKISETMSPSLPLLEDYDAQQSALF